MLFVCHLNIQCLIYVFYCSSKSNGCAAACKQLIHPNVSNIRMFRAVISRYDRRLGLPISSMSGLIHCLQDLANQTLLLLALPNCTENNFPWAWDKMGQPGNAGKAIVFIILPKWVEAYRHGVCCPLRGLPVGCLRIGVATPWDDWPYRQM